MNLLRFQVQYPPLDFDSFCIVSKAFDIEEKRNVCLKMIQSDIFEQHKDSISREIEILSKLDHPNIVKCFGHFYQDEKLFIVMEYVEGGDLRSYLKKNKPPLSEEFVLSFFNQLVSGLQYAHSFKTIHLNLKPNNILFAKNNIVKIIGFNDFKKVSSICSGSKKIETMYYMSPEVIFQQKYSFSSDVWSLGCIMYELMTGKVPFFHNDIDILKKMLETQKIHLIEGNYSHILKIVVIKMLEKNPKERITFKGIQTLLPSNEQILKLQARIQHLEDQNSQLQSEKLHLKKQIFQLQTKIQNLENQNFLDQQNLQDSQPSIQENQLQTTKEALQISPHHSQIEKWIGIKKWQLLYKATRDGFNASSFHMKCDHKGPTVTIITSKEGYNFGGFTPLSWNSSISWGKDSSKQSFIFTLTNPHNIPPTKYPLVELECAIGCYACDGPCFGCDGDIHVCDQSNQNTVSYTNFPDSYSDTTGRGRNTFTGHFYFSTREIEVFRVHLQ